MYSNLVKNMIEKFNENELLLTQRYDHQVEILGTCHLDELEHFITGLQIIADLRCPYSTLHLISNLVEVRLRNPNAEVNTNMLYWHPVLIGLDLHNLDDLSSMLEGLWYVMDNPSAD